MKERDTKKSQWKRVLFRKDQFSLFQNECDPTTWEVSFKSSTEGHPERYLRKRFQATSVETAIDTAKKLAGFGAPKVRRFMLTDAFSATLDSIETGQKPHTNEAFRYWVRRFLGWLGEKRPEVRYWDALSCEIVEDYLRDYRGTSKRHPLAPIRSTALFMARRYGAVNFLDGFRAQGRLKKTPAEVWLSDVVAFVDFLRDKGALAFETGAALQGLAGLQLQEALRLSWDKVDLGRGLIEISGEVKNVYRNRAIPIHSRVIEVLRRAKWATDKRRVIEAAGPVIPSPAGMFYGENWLNYSKALRLLMREWNPNIKWSPKDLRNTLPTFAVTNGLHSTLWEQYIGHSPVGVTAQHYIPRLAGRSLGENEALDRQMAIFRRLVVEPLEAGNGGAEILNGRNRGDDRLGFSIL